jgi:hypothetical protein
VQVGAEGKTGRSSGGKRVSAAPRTGEAARTQTETRPCNSEADQGGTKDTAQPARETSEGSSASAVRSDWETAARCARYAVPLWQERTVVEDCSDGGTEGPLTRVTVEPVTVVPDDSDAEEVCCVYESLGDDNDEDSASCRDARFVLEQVDEMCENFENEYCENFTATKSPPSDVERDEDDDDIPTRFFTNVTVVGGSRQAKIDTGAFAIWVSAAVYREMGTVPLARGEDANAADGRALPVLGSGRILMGLWGQTFDVPVRVMRTLPTGILIGRRFLIKHGVDLDFASLRGSFPKVIRGRHALFSGRIRVGSGPEGE